MTPSRRSLAQLGAIAVAIALGVIFAASTPTTAHAAPIASATTSPEILVSTDGVNFAPTLAGSVLVNAGQLVPGESITASLWMRNPTPAPAVVRVGVGSVAVPSAEYGNGVTMSIWNSGTSTTSSRPMAGLNPCEVLIPSQQIAGNGTIRIDLTFAMGDLTGQSAQGEAATMQLAIAMRDAAAGAFSSSICGAGDQGAIAFTGSEPPLLAITVGIALVGAGIALVVIRRRRRDASAEASGAVRDDAGETS